MDKALALELIAFISVRLERESAWLGPQPRTFMNDPYALLTLLKTKAGLTDNEVDTCMVDAQKKAKGL